MYYVYILLSKKDNKLYTGYTENLKRRFAEHTEGRVRATRYRKPLRLVYYEAYESQADAKTREWNLKNSQGARTALKRRLGNCLRQDHSV
ncbi:GIY-YIG nuclease family protein [Candidatus Kaiserbacteria bacterium]|nr:GIY-YIG nuclease family protein [Candidatus Kaiserbacteria bacterium]